MKVILAEDSILLREGIVRLLDEANITVLAAVSDGQKLLESVKLSVPDIVITDVRMPPSYQNEGILAALEIRKLFPKVGILVLSQYVERVYAAQLLAVEPKFNQASAGVGYLLKDRITKLEQFIDTLQTIVAGGTVIDPDVVRILLQEKQTRPMQKLSPREREVLSYIAGGKSNSGIAKSLHISLGAVEKHISSIFARLELPFTNETHRRVLAVLQYLQEK